MVRVSPVTSLHRTNWFLNLTSSSLRANTLRRFKLSPSFEERTNVAVPFFFSGTTNLYQSSPCVSDSCPLFVSPLFISVAVFQSLPAALASGSMAVSRNAIIKNLTLIVLSILEFLKNVGFVRTNAPYLVVCGCFFHRRFTLRGHICWNWQIGEPSSRTIILEQSSLHLKVTNKTNRVPTFCKIKRKEFVVERRNS